MEVMSTFPSTKKIGVSLDRRHTDFLLTSFEDRNLLIVTQYQKLGTLVHVTKDNLPLDRREETFSSQVLLGKDEPVTHVYARNIAKIVMKSETKPLLLSLALKDYTPALLRALEIVIRDHLVGHSPEEEP